MAAKQLNCNPGNYQCGGICINNSRKCISKIEATGDSKAFAALVSNAVASELGAKSAKEGKVNSKQLAEWQANAQGQDLLDRLNGHINWWANERGLNPTVEVLDSVDKLTPVASKVLGNYERTDKEDSLRDADQLRASRIAPGADEALPGSSYIQKALVRDYTRKLFEELNAEARKPSGNKSLVTKKELIDDALTRAKKYEGTSYRGTVMPEEVLDQLQPGAIFQDPALLSTSLDLDEAVVFAENNAIDGYTLPVMLIINGKTGVDITGASFAPLEQEVLFRSNTQFEVTEQAEVEGTIYVTIKERS